jgi:hypothetical protein
MTDSYRIRSAETWEAARDAYLAGETAEGVCARFDLGLRTFRARAADEGWRRADRPDPEPFEYSDDLDAGIDEAELRRMAGARMASAVRRGLVSEALRWARLDDIIARRAEAAERRARNDAREQSRDDLDQNRRANDLLRKATASARTLERQARTLIATDRAATALHDLHDLHPVSADPADTVPADPPLNRADRRRQAKSGRKRR